MKLTASQLQSHLACKRITFLNHLERIGEIKAPDEQNSSAALLQMLGNEHEEKYLDFLEKDGFSIKRFCEVNSIESTIQAMKEGYDIIAQPKLENGEWMGYADVLIKVEGKSELGDYHYEVQDTKLSQETKTGTVLQLCLYSEMITKIQGRIPDRFHVVKPDRKENSNTLFEIETFNYEEYRAYFEYIKGTFEKDVKSSPEDTYPLPVERCSVCKWWANCRGKWVEDDHLTLVAGLQNTHLNELEKQGIDSLEGFAKEKKSLKSKPKSGNIQTYDKLHEQAQVQLRGRSKDNYFEVRDDWFKKSEHENKGLNRLPEPSPGDIYFDFEGDHFFDKGGFQYLFGYIHQPSPENNEYIKYWANNRNEEKEAFVQFMESIMERWAKFPDFHIYHFAPYEPSAMTNLATKYACYEEEVDQLLREHKFIDLHRVIKESMHAAVEKYSLKDLESFAGFSRDTDLREASKARQDFSTALHLSRLDVIGPEVRAIIEEYNKDDCLATQAIHKWLEQIFKQKNQNGLVNRPVPSSNEVSEAINERDKRIEELSKALMLQYESSEDEKEKKAYWLLAHCPGYFAREKRIQFFEYFRLKEMEDSDLFNEKGAIAYLKYESTLPKEPRQRISRHRYTFPKQDLGSDIIKSGAVESTDGSFRGNLVSYDSSTNSVVISTNDENYKISTSVVKYPKFNTEKQENALWAYLSFVANNGFKRDTRFNAVHDLVLKNKPNLRGTTLEELIKTNPNKTELSIDAVVKLDQSTLAIQGPPGTGKTYSGGKMILELVRNGKKVGVTATSHKTIQNLINKTKEHAEEDKFSINTIHFDDPNKYSEDYNATKNKKVIESAIKDGYLVGATHFFWTGDTVGQDLDYLFVDEAGQMSLTLVIAAARCARNLVLLGDPQQLEQPQQGAHPEGSDISALEHVIDGKDTISDDRGIFFDTTYRLTSPLAELNSKLYYDSRLSSHLDTIRQGLLPKSKLIPGTGHYFYPIEHASNRDKSEEEVSTIYNLIQHFLKGSYQWKDRDGKIHPITAQDFRVVAPFNMQVDLLKEKLPEGIQVGTVDKFQGQEAPIVIYSMTSSSAEESPRGMTFLFDPHRFNVATSRAQCVNIIVANPTLFQVECRTTEQMRWANGLCLFKELAHKIDL